MNIRERLHAVALERGLRKTTVRSYEVLLQPLSLLGLVDPDIQTVQDAIWTIDNRSQPAQARAVGSARRGQIEVVVNEKKLTAEACFDLYVNDDLLHQDGSKARFLASLPGLIQQMVSLVINGLGALWATRNVALTVLNE